MGRSRDANGFTVFTPLGVPYYGYNPADTNTSRTRIICLSKSIGSDVEGPGAGQGNGSPTKPYATITKGMSRTRPNTGSPDWVLLDNRDTWTDESFGDLSQHYGQSQDNPFIIGSWDRLASNNPPIPNPGTGGTRPIVRTAHGVFPISNCNAYIAILGIYLYAYTRDSTNPSYNPAGVEADAVTVGPWCHDFLIEDCEVSHYTVGIDTQCQPSVGGGANVWNRRNIVHDQFDDVGKVSKGIGAGNCRPNYRLEEVLVDTNGWSPATGNQGSSLNHNLYLTAGYLPDGSGHWMDAHITGVICSNERWTEQIRCGGNLFNNLWFVGHDNFCVLGLSNPDITMSQDGDVLIGNQWTPPSGEWEPVGGESVDSYGQQWNLTTLIIKDCVFTQGNSGSTALAVTSDHGYDNLFTLNNNVGWKIGALITNPSNILLSQTNNRFTSDLAQATAWGWLHPDRTPATYMDEVIEPGVSGHTYADYIRRCRQQRKGNWNPLLMAESVNDYIRQGVAKTMRGSAYAGGGTIATGTITVRDAAGTTASAPVTLNISAS